MAYDPELPSCFGETDRVFGSHELERTRAFAWLVMLRERQATWLEVRRQIEEFLRTKDAAVPHVVDQVDRARLMLGPWLWGPLDDE